MHIAATESVTLCARMKSWVLELEPAIRVASLLESNLCVAPLVISRFRGERL